MEWNDIEGKSLLRIFYPFREAFVNLNGLVVTQGQGP